jgi:hypothetical protein
MSYYATSLLWKKSKARPGRIDKWREVNPKGYHGSGIQHSAAHHNIICTKLVSILKKWEKLWIWEFWTFQSQEGQGMGGYHAAEANGDTISSRKCHL